MNSSAAAILAVIVANPPMPSAEIAARVGLKPGTTREWLRDLIQLGLAGRTSDGRGALWGTPEKTAAYAAQEGRRLIERRAKRAAKEARAKEVRLERADEEAFCEAWLVPVQRIVPASQCAPVRGINSVFQLAEMV